MARTSTPSSAQSSLESVCAGVAEAGPGDAVDGVRPLLVARPSSTAEVSDVLRVAHERGLRIVPRGHGTKLSWGRPPEAVDVVVDLSGMDRLLEHAAGDLIVATEAGMPLATLQTALAESGQRLVLDETIPGATVGGTLAANASGPRRLVAGTARDLLIGVTIVRADGVVAKAGGRVVKNVAGYDLGKLVIGSFGTLAVITEAIFRLHPVPRAEAWVSVPVSDPEDAGRRTLAVLHSQAVPAAVELAWTGSSGRVSVLLEGHPVAVEARAAAVRAALGAATPGEADAGPARVYPWTDPAEPADRAAAVKLTFALSALPQVLRAVPGEMTVTGSVGAGVLYGALPAHTPPDSVAVALARLRAACAAAGGSVVLLDAAPEVKSAVDVWGEVPGLDLMRRVKDQFDPGRLLSPGRFVGGI